MTKERVKNYNISVKDYDGRLIFLRKVVEGGASRSYGIEVAKLAGLPPEVIDRAGELLKNLESGELDEAGKPRLISNSDTGEGERRGQPGQLSQADQANLFPGEAVLLERLRLIDLDKTTPMDALKALYKLKEIVDN